MDEGRRVNTTSPLWPGVPLALASALLFGLTAPLSKVLLVQMDAFALAAVLYLGAGCGLALTLLVRIRGGRLSSEAKLTRAQAPRLAAVALFGGILGPALLMLGIQGVPASAASLLLNLEGIATMLIAWVVFRENADARIIIGAAAILLGAVILSWSGGVGAMPSGGSLLIAAACLCWGIDNNLSRGLSGSDPVQVAMVKCLVAGPVNLGLSLLTGGMLPPLPAIAAAALVGYICIGLSLVLFLFGLRHLGAARTGAYYSVAPFFGALLSLALLDEPLTMQLVLAGLLMAIGLALHLFENHSHEHLHEDMEHDHAHVHDAHHQHAHDGPVREPHSHIHRHARLAHSHAHFPDLHHRHGHAAPVDKDAQ